jgi:hypothetical protein
MAGADGYFAAFDGWGFGFWFLVIGKNHEPGRGDRMDAA